MNEGQRGPALECDGITKVIGRRLILDHVSLRIHQGEIFGLCGPNGAGKTTLLKIIGGLTHPTSGRVILSGAVDDRGGGGPGLPLAIVPENPQFVAELSGPANLRLLARIRKQVSNAAIRDTMRRVGLDPDDRRRVGAYSLGMRQRLGLAQALMESPRVMLLDEPTNGLDPLGRRDMERLLAAEAERGTAILMASHLLPVVERVAHRVGLISRGVLVRELTVHERQSALCLTVSSDEDWRRLAAWPAAVSLHRNEGAVPSGVVFTELEVPEAIRQLVRLGVSIEAVFPRIESLEDAFVELFGGE